ncbi:DNA topology modulation protein FlaR [Alkalihalobacillus sp. NPDC078783]
MKKIHIIGSVGSGKTTFAKKLSTQTGIQHYELDNMVWQRVEGSGDIKRSMEERDTYLSNTLQLDQWIIEGVHHIWVRPSLDQADLVIFLDTPYWIRNYRIIKRYIRQKVGVEKANYDPTVKMFLNMFKWNIYFEKESKPNILILLEQYKDKVVILNSNADARDLIESRLRK